MSIFLGMSIDTLDTPLTRLFIRKLRGSDKIPIKLRLLKIKPVKIKFSKIPIKTSLIEYFRKDLATLSIIYTAWVTI